MNFLFSHIRKDMILNALTVLVLGAILLFYPIAATALACFALGALLMIYGGILLRQHRSDPDHGSLGLTMAVVLLASGAFVILCYRALVSLIPFLMGLFFLFSGVRETACALTLKDRGYASWQVNLALALIMIAAGVLLLFDPFTAAALAVRFTGIMLICDAISQLWNIHCLSRTQRGFFK